MIHQWQDEVAYIQPGQEVIKEYKRWVLNEDGERIEVTERQKKRPKDWHNKDFKQMASVVGIPAIGNKCHGNPAKMPEPQSYNRKFICSCVASNGHPLTVWSTRAVNAICQVCEQPFREVKKGGKIIRVEQSHVEKPGEDAIEEAHKEKYRYFKKFTSKDLKDEFIEHYNENEEHPITEMVEGVYQKGHNAYKDGYTHWIAFNTSEVLPDEVKTPEVEIEKPKSKRKSKVEKPSEPGKIEGEADKEKPKKRGRNPMKKEIEQPTVEPTEEPTAKIVEEDKKVVASEDRSYKNKQDLIDLYKEFGSIKAVAEFFGVTSGAIIYQAKKNEIDFNNL